MKKSDKTPKIFTFQIEKETNAHSDQKLTFFSKTPVKHNSEQVITFYAENPAKDHSMWVRAGFGKYIEMQERKQKAQEIIEKSTKKDVADLKDVLQISASTQLKKAIAVVEKMQPYESVVLASDISEKAGRAVAEKLPKECQLILSPEIPEQVVIAIASNMPSLTRLVFPATMPQKIVEEGVKALGMRETYKEIYLCHDMPIEVAKGAIQVLPKFCFLAIDARMTPEYSEKLFSNLPPNCTINRDDDLPSDLKVALRKVLLSQCRFCIAELGLNSGSVLQYVSKTECHKEKTSPTSKQTC